MNQQKHSWNTVDSTMSASYVYQSHVSRYLGKPNAFLRERLPTAYAYYQTQFPSLGGKALNLGSWVSVLCCFHEDRVPSLRIHLSLGAFRCFGCGAKGKDVLAFHQRRYGMSFQAAARHLGAWGER